MTPLPTTGLKWPLALLAAMLSGGLLALGFAPWQLWPGPILGITILTWVVAGTNLRTGFLLGMVCGFVLHIATIWWVGAQAGPAWLALAAFMSLWVGLAAAATAAMTRVRGWVFLVPAAWAAVEFGAGLIPFGGFPWLRLGHTVIDQPLSGWLPVVGTAGATWLVGLVGCALLATVKQRDFIAVIAAGMAFAGGGAILLIPVAPASDTVTVGMVQGNVELSELGGYIAATGATPHHLSETIFLLADARANNRPLDLIVWAENSTDRDPSINNAVHAQVVAAVELAQVPIYLGALTTGPQPQTRQTTSQVWVPGQGLTAQYHKRNLAPFGEFVPLRELIEPIFPQVSRVGAQSIPGTAPGVVTVPLANQAPVEVGTVICYELAYDQTVYDTVRHGAQLLVAQSTTHNFSGTTEPAQQMVINRVRAAELRREFVALTLNGYSGLIDAKGKLSATTSEYTAAHRIVELPRRAGITPAVIITGWLGPLQVAVAVLASGWGIRVTGNLDWKPSSCKEQL